MKRVVTSPLRKFGWPIRASRNPGGHLFQQRIVEGGDQRAGIGGAAVQADAETIGAAISGDPAVIRNEAVLRVLGGDPALQRMAVEAQVLLARHPAFRRADDRPLGDADLRLDDIDSGHHLAHGMLYLDARVYLDEVDRAAVDIHEEFRGAGVAVVRGLGQAYGGLAKRPALVLVEVGGRGPLHHLLMAALHGAVPLEQVHHVAVVVAQQLDLDVAGPAHQLLQKDLVAAEGGQGLAPAGGDPMGQLAGALDHPHAAAAAAPAGLGHHGIADRLGQARRLGFVVGQRAARRHHRDAGLLGQVPRLDLGAQGAHHRGPGADEGDSGGRHRLGEFGVFREEAVAGMDGVDLHLAGDLEDAFDVEVGLDRLLALADQKGLVGLEAVQGEAVFMGINCHRADAELARRAEHPDRDLAAVGHQELPDAPATWLPACHNGFRLSSPAGVGRAAEACTWGL
jgi:hypothetical protein